MTNVVHIGKYYFPDAGGIESVTITLAKGAVLAGYSVSVVCFEKIPAKSEEIIDGVKVFRAPILKNISSQPIGFKYFLLCLREAKSADIVHLHAPNMLGALCALFMRKRVRLLVHWHSDVINKGILGRLLRPLESALLKRADCIVATSPVYAQASQPLSEYAQKVRIVPIGVPDSHPIGYAQLPPVIAEKIAGKRIILSVGRLVPYKGFDVLIRSAKYLQLDCIVLIVGGGPWLHDLQNMIVEENVTDRVFLTGRLSDEALHGLFRLATLYCLPSISRAEAFGVVLLEAMAHKLPIVASNIPGSGVPWVNQDGVSGINVMVNNPEALADACNQILSSISLHEKLASGARQRFESEFTEKVFVKNIVELYKALQ